MDAAAPTLEHDLSKPQSVQDDHAIPQGCAQSISDSPAYYIGAAGILRYKRESDNRDILPASVQSQHLTEYVVKCEYCGETAQPSLDLPCVQWPETAVLFCCARWKELYEMLEKHRCSSGDRCDLWTGVLTSLGEKPATEMKEHHLQGREMEDPTRFTMDLPSGLGEHSEVGVYEDASVQPPVVEAFASESNVLSFRLSCAPREGSWTVYPNRAAEQPLKLKEEEEQVSVPFSDRKPLQFGVCHHQEGSEFLQKDYSSGMRFLTMFPDGSAQVFYPSGLLALIVMVTEGNGRVCIVYDDSDAPHQPVRAIFQSDGRASCYHSNGNIWLSLNRSGGQCLDEKGTRVRRWSWIPTPLQPVFLSLNKSVGVRVLGREQAFVSFLARGQQAKFSVGTCDAQDEWKPVGAASGPPVLKEELFVLAAQIRIQLAFQRLHQCLRTPSHPWLPKTRHAPHLNFVSQKLLASSGDVTMSESDRAFIHRCLQDCL